MTTHDVRVLCEAQAWLGEGTCWSVREQALYWVDIDGRQLQRWHAEPARRARWAFDTEVSAVAECADGGLIVALRHGFARFDPAHGGAPQWLHRPPEEPPGNRFNDGKCDAAGRFWCGSMDRACRAPTGHLYTLHPDGRCVRHALGFAVTNGPGEATRPRRR
jgi:xylono-1,5-lactonase